MNDKTKVLIVEDEMPLAMSMISVLSQAGCDADVAVTGRKAIEKASEKKFDLIALDVELPDISGFEVCSEIKQRHISYKTPVIFLSAATCIQNIEDATKRGAVDFIIKPFDATELVYKVIYYARAVNHEQFAKERGVII